MLVIMSKQKERHTALTISKALGEQKIGNGWMARCTAHDDGTPNFSLRKAGDGRPPLGMYFNDKLLRPTS